MCQMSQPKNRNEVNYGYQKTEAPEKKALLLFVESASRGRVLLFQLLM